MHALRTIAVLSALFAVPAGAVAQQKLDERWQLDMDGAIRIHNYNGTVTIRGWDRDSVRVTGTIASTERRAFFGGGSGKSAKMGVESSGGRSPLADLTILVPARARLSIRGAATTIDIRDFAGTLDVSTLSGRLHIAGTPAEVTAETMDGDLEVEASPTYLRARTATGRLTWTGSSDDATLTTVSGAVVMKSGAIERTRVETISGDIRFAGGVKPGGRVSFETHGGDLVLEFSRETRAELAYEARQSTILGTEVTRNPKAASGAVQYVGIPRGGLAGGVRPADISARTFKGRLTVTQP